MNKRITHQCATGDHGVLAESTSHADLCPGTDMAEMPNARALANLARKSSFIHPTAEVSERTRIGARTKIWNLAQIREGVEIGEDCVLGRGVYVDAHVKIGAMVKIQNNASIFHGVTIEDCVFIGPHVCFTNDLYPRAVNPDLSFKEPSDWIRTPTRIGFGAAIGANCTIRCGVTIGPWAMVGAGSVITRDIPAHCLCYGIPAYIHGKVCKCGQRVKKNCPECGYSVGDKNYGK